MLVEGFMVLPVTFRGIIAEQKSSFGEIAERGWC